MATAAGATRYLPCATGYRLAGIRAWLRGWLPLCCYRPDRTGEQSYLDAADGAIALLLKPLREGGCAHYDIWPTIPGGMPVRPSVSHPQRRHIRPDRSPGAGGQIGRTRAHGGHPAPCGRSRPVRYGLLVSYDLRFTAPATMAYHSLHISLLEVIARLSGDHAFTSTALRWRSYLRRPACRFRAAAGKARFVLGAGHG